MWRELSDSDKQEYIGDYENAKVNLNHSLSSKNVMLLILKSLLQADYCEQLKNYHNSPQYQNFLSSVSKKKSILFDFILV